MKEPRLTDDDDGDTLEEDESSLEPKITDEDDGDTFEEETKECCERTSKEVSKQWENTFDEAIENELRNKSIDSSDDDDTPTEHKQKINEEIMKLIMYRSQRKWLSTIAIISIFGGLLLLMLIFIAMGKDMTPEWKEILLVLLGAFVGSFSRVIDHWFNNSQAEEKLLESPND